MGLDGNLISGSGFLRNAAFMGFAGITGGKFAVICSYSGAALSDLSFKPHLNQVLPKQGFEMSGMLC